MPKQPTKRTLSLLGLAAAVVSILLGMGLVPRRGADRVAAALEQELRRQGVDTALQNRVREGGDSIDASALGAELGRRGIARLTPDQLRRRAEFLLRIDSAATTEQCAARLMGTLTPPDMIRLVGTLDDQRLETWAEITVAAVRQELHPDGPAPARATQGEVSEALAQIQRYLGPADEQRLVAVMRDLAVATAEDRCWTALTIGRTVLVLPATVQGEVLGTLAKLEAGL